MHQGTYKKMRRPYKGHYSFNEFQADDSTSSSFNSMAGKTIQIFVMKKPFTASTNVVSPPELNERTVTEKPSNLHSTTNNGPSLKLTRDPIKHRRTPTAYQIAQHSFFIKKRNDIKKAQMRQRLRDKLWGYLPVVNGKRNVGKSTDNLRQSFASNHCPYFSISTPMRPNSVAKKLLETPEAKRTQNFLNKTQLVPQRKTGENSNNSPAIKRICKLKEMLGYKYGSTLWRVKRIEKEKDFYAFPYLGLSVTKKEQ